MPVHLFDLILDLLFEFGVRLVDDLSHHLRLLGCRLDSVVRPNVAVLVSSRRLVLNSEVLGRVLVDFEACLVLSCEVSRRGRILFGESRATTRIERPRSSRFLETCVQFRAMVLLQLANFVVVLSLPLDSAVHELQHRVGQAVVLGIVARIFALRVCHVLQGAPFQQKLNQVWLLQLNDFLQD